VGQPAAAIDWAELRRQALAAAEHAYAPYSKYRVGAAALIDDGRIVSGCNIENASYGLTMCAENTLIGQLQMDGGGRIVALYTVGNGAPNTPCGRCRQLLWEFGGADCLVAVNDVPTRLDVLIPSAFPDASTFVPPGS